MKNVLAEKLKKFFCGSHEAQIRARPGIYPKPEHTQQQLRRMEQGRRDPQVQMVAFALSVAVLVLAISCQSCSATHGYDLDAWSSGSGQCSAFQGHLKVVPDNSAEYAHLGDDIAELTVQVSYISPWKLRVSITDASAARWEVPQSVVPRPTVNCDYSRATSGPHPELLFSYSSKPFGFYITRKSNGQVLFDSRIGNLVFKDQYLEISTALSPNASIYGFAESTRPYFRISDAHSADYTLWNSDILSKNLYLNTYGSHPFYLDVRPGGLAHGVLLLNSNAMDIKYRGAYLTYRVTGGILDFYFFAGPEPLSVVEQYTQIIGLPAPMPYWSFGFHQCRWGYKNISYLQSVVGRYVEEKIPMDVIWNDLDYMDDYKDFTLDPVNYPENEFRAFLNNLHAGGRRYVMIVDPGISVNKSYPTYLRGLKQDIFLKQQGQRYLGQVWPGPVHFPDFLHPGAQRFWTNEIALFHKRVPFDGLWIDMNEVSNFCTGVTCRMPADGSPCPGPGGQTDCCLECSDAGATRWDHPPYAVNSSGSMRPLGNKTVPASALHYGGILEYNAHSLYGATEAKVTHSALQTVTGRRPFVLTRSTFVGTGAHAAHWTGDNAATFSDLKWSIATVLNFGLLGVPMVGADICGFSGSTNEELCARWIQLGAAYPFARAHSSRDSIRQELYLWPKVASATRASLGLRYRVLPYLYTQAFHAHRHGHPIARPLFFSFPSDPATLGLDSQFMLGPSLLVSPVVTEGATSVEAYFPAGTWFSLSNYSDSLTLPRGGRVRLDAPVDGAVNVHVYEGSVVAMHRGGGLTTAEARKTPFSLLVTLGAAEDAEASGEVFLDDGDNVRMELLPETATLVTFAAVGVKGGGVRVTSNVTHGEFALSQKWIVERITVVSPSASAYRKSVLEVANLSLPIGKEFELVPQPMITNHDWC